MNIKHFLASVLFVAVSAAVPAQSLFVQQKDGSVHEYDLNNVSQVSFGQSIGKQDIRTITYHANDGSGKAIVSEFHFGKVIFVGDGVSFSRSDYQFLGWNTSPDGSGASYVRNERCNLTFSFDLYAQWKLIRGSHNGHDWVDLGLPSGTKWATTNVGATTIEDYGDYFAWGETQPKLNYDWSTYKYGSAEDELTKYCLSSSLGLNDFTDTLSVLQMQDDAAAVHWGGNWRLPTPQEVQELRDYCKFSIVCRNDVWGACITSKANGNAIFLPFGSFFIGSEIHGLNEGGDYWSSAIASAERSDAAITFNFDCGAKGLNGTNRRRCLGQLVRPVIK